MENTLLQSDIIEGLLRPETDTENKLVRQPEFIKGLFWGKPRYGHPEGKVIFHIAEILKNIDSLTIDTATRRRLRLIAFLHDTFKYDEDMNRPRDWSRHHSVLACQFAQRFIDDGAVLKIIHHHDEAFYSWRASHVFDRKEKGELRFRKLLKVMGADIQLFYLFFKCDTQTGDKNQKPIVWFEKNVQGIEVVTF